MPAQILRRSTMIGGISLAWSPTTGWGAGVNGDGTTTFQGLGLDGSAPPFPVSIPRSSGTYSPISIAGAPDGRFVMVVENTFYFVNADGSITRAPLDVPGLSGRPVRVFWDGEDFAAVGMRSATGGIDLRRGPTMSDVHVIVAAPPAGISFGGLDVAVSGPSALVSWNERTATGTGCTIAVARIGLPTGGRAFSVLSSRSVVMTDPTSAYAWDSPSVVQPTASNAAIAWIDLRWGQQEMYWLGLSLGACM
jgi:hypothetical protein